MLNDLENHIISVGLSDMVASANIITQDGENYVEKQLDLLDMVESLRDIAMPADYVNKLVRMFQDIEVSKNLNTQFRVFILDSSTDSGKDEDMVEVLKIKDIKIRKSFKSQSSSQTTPHDAINIKILHAGAWATGSFDRASVSLPLELEDYIQEFEGFYKRIHSGRKLQWSHHLRNGTIAFANNAGRFDLIVTTFQMAVLFTWNQRSNDKISYESLRLATELSDPELRRTLWSLIAFPKRPLLLYDPIVQAPKDFDENSVFWINQEFSIIKNGKPQKCGKINLIGRLQLSTERAQPEENQSIVLLRNLRTQEAIIRIMKMRKRMTMSALQVGSMKFTIFITFMVIK